MAFAVRADRMPFDLKTMGWLPRKNCPEAATDEIRILLAELQFDEKQLTIVTQR